MNERSILSSYKNKYFSDHKQTTSRTNIEHKWSFPSIILSGFINFCKGKKGFLHPLKVSALSASRRNPVDIKFHVLGCYITKTNTDRYISI